MRLQSSLKWLIDKRARLLGEINSLEKRLPHSQIELNREIARTEIRLAQLNSRLAQLKQQRTDTDEHLSYIAGLRSDLNAIDGALKQHDVQISPESIKPIRPQRSNQYLSHGEITRQIFACLKAAYPDPRTAMDVVGFIVSGCKIELSTAERLDLRFRIRQRLSYLTWQKKILRLHGVKTQEEGRWTLRPSLPPP